MKEFKIYDHLILFDGVCNLCNSSIDLVIRNDKKNIFHFASLQSDFGQRFSKAHNLSTENFETIVYFENGKLYFKSSAALRIARHMSGIYSLLFIFIILPPFIRDFVYNVVAKNRYKWFGKRDTCRLPTKEEKEKFYS